MTSTLGVPVYELPGVQVAQPPHLEGDPSLATEILPGPPSLQAIRQTGLTHRRDPKKPGVSYLPVSDPGTTYSGHTFTAMTATEPEGPRRKRARVDKGSATNRAQRASARNVNAAPSFSSDVTMAAGPPPSSPPPMQMLLQPDSDSMSVQMDAEPGYLSRSNSLQNVDENMNVGSGSAVGKGRKEKGKGKEKVVAPVPRVKEEPVNFTLPPADPSLLGLAPNEDHCSSCRALGALVYCDGCPRAFHFWCLNPPMEPSDLPEGDSRWFCPSCSVRQNPPPSPAPSFFAPVIQQVQTSIPMEYRLPDEIRGFFKDVATNVKGGYVDASEIKQPRLNRHGQLEDRDPYRLKDRNGAPVLCFRCGTSALPDDAAASSPAVKRARQSSPSTSKSGVWKSIVSCDYCDLHWHLDCLDPPLPSMPSFGKKWMCPSHAEHVLQPKRRIPRYNAPPIEISRTNQWNNGNIEIIQSEPASAIPKVSVDEVMINGRRYRVPEKVVVLDFWNKVKNGHRRREFDIPSAVSSPLTTLSELSDLDVDESVSPPPATMCHDEEDVRIAQLLCRLRVNSVHDDRSTSISRVRRQNSSRTDRSHKQPRAAGPSQKVAVEKLSEPKESDRRGRRSARSSTVGRANGLGKVEQDDIDYLPSAGPDKNGQGSQNTLASEAESSTRPRRSGRVPQPRKRSPVPSHIPSRDSVASTPDHKNTAPVKTLPQPAPTAPASTPSHDATQSNPPTSSSLKIRLPRFNGLSISSNTGRSSAPAQPSQSSSSNSVARAESRKSSTNEARPHRAPRGRKSTAASVTGTPSPSKLGGKNIAV